MKKSVYLMGYHYNESGDALAISFDKNFVLAPEEEGRPVRFFRFIDWADACRSANDKLEAASAALSAAEEKESELNRIASDLADAEIELENRQLKGEDVAEELAEASRAWNNANSARKFAELARNEAEEELETAKSALRHLGGHLSEEWK